MPSKPPGAMPMAARPVTGAAHPVASENTDIDPRNVLSSFERLIAVIREKAAAKNSLLIRQRKNQCLSALESYNSVDKQTMPHSLIETMDLVCKRVETPDARLKPDIDMIVEPQSDCVWIKATGELIKMLY